MTNSVINDMIETIEYFAQSQPDFPVYNVLGEVHTYHDLKVDSDSLAAKIDSLALPGEITSSSFWWARIRHVGDFCSLNEVRSCLYPN